MGVVINLKADTGLVDRSENTTRFYKDIRKYPTLTREDEIKWFTMLKNGSPREREAAREYIWLCNQRLVVAAAKNWATTDTLMDYTNEANFGLSQAIETFDVNRGVKFCSYAMWYIKRAINQYEGESKLVKQTNYSKTFHVISKATNDFIQKNERNPTADELLEIVTKKYKKDIKDKNDLLDVRIGYVDESAEDDEATSNYGDIAAYNRASASCNGYEKTEADEFDKKLVASLLNELTPRKQTIIKLMFGLHDEDNGLRREYTNNEIAEKVGLTPERVRQLEEEAIKELKEAYINKIGCSL